MTLLFKAHDIHSVITVVRKRDDDREQQLVVFEEVIPPPVYAGLPPAAEGDKEWPQKLQSGTRLVTRCMK